MTFIEDSLLTKKKKHSEVRLISNSNNNMFKDEQGRTVKGLANNEKARFVMKVIGKSYKYMHMYIFSK